MSRLDKIRAAHGSTGNPWCRCGKNIDKCDIWLILQDKTIDCSECYRDRRSLEEQLKYYKERFFGLQAAYEKVRTECVETMLAHLRVCMHPVTIIFDEKQEIFVVMRKPVIMEDEGRHQFVDKFPSRAAAQAWIDKQENEYFKPSDYYIVGHNA